jgi:hypothetical protein
LPGTLEKKDQFSVVYSHLALPLLLMMQQYLFAPRTENLAYRDFKILLKAGKLENVTLAESAARSDTPSWTENPVWRQARRRSISLSSIHPCAHQWCVICIFGTIEIQYSG